MPFWNVYVRKITNYDHFDEHRFENVLRNLPPLFPVFLYWFVRFRLLLQPSVFQCMWLSFIHKCCKIAPQIMITNRMIRWAGRPEDITKARNNRIIKQHTNCSHWSSSFMCSSPSYWNHIFFLLIHCLHSFSSRK